MLRLVTTSNYPMPSARVVSNDLSITTLTRTVSKYCGVLPLGTYYYAK